MRRSLEMRKHFIITTLVLSILLLSSACGSKEAELPEIGTLNVGYIPSLAYSPLFVAAEKGYFEEQGLQVELQSFTSGSTMISLLATGDLDVGAGETGTALFNAINQDLDVAVVGGLASQPVGFGAVPLLVRADLYNSGEITSPADLQGKQVALNVERGMAEYLLGESLARAGLTVSDVILVPMPFPEIPTAFANQAIDAAILPHPLAAKAIGSGDAVVLLGGDEIVDNPQNGVIYFGKRLLQGENKEVGIRFLVAYLKAARDLYGDGWLSDENVAAINKYTQTPVETIKKSITYYSDPDGNINQTSVERMQTYLVGRGYTEFSEPLSLSKIIDLKFLDEALERVGKFEK
jgi:NitT/TauT family transport system substrate-binding protein